MIRVWLGCALRFMLNPSRMFFQMCICLNSDPVNLEAIKCCCPVSVSTHSTWISKWKDCKLDSLLFWCSPSLWMSNRPCRGLEKRVGLHLLVPWRFSVQWLCGFENKLNQPSWEQTVLPNRTGGQRYMWNMIHSDLRRAALSLFQTRNEVGYTQRPLANAWWLIHTSETVSDWSHSVSGRRLTQDRWEHLSHFYLVHFMN